MNETALAFLLARHVPVIYITESISLCRHTIAHRRRTSARSRAVLSANKPCSARSALPGRAGQSDRRQL